MSGVPKHSPVVTTLGLMPRLLMASATAMQPCTGVIGTNTSAVPPPAALIAEATSAPWAVGEMKTSVTLIPAASRGGAKRSLADAVAPASLVATTATVLTEPRPPSTSHFAIPEMTPGAPGW